MKGFGLVMLPLSVLPFVAVRDDVIREHDAYLIARNSRAPLGAAPGPALPGRAPAPPLDSRIRPVISLGRGANITLGTRDGSVLIELTRQATTEGRRVLADANGDGAADVTIGAGLAGVKIVACQTSVAALAGSGSGRRADGGTTVHVPASALGAAPRFVVTRGDASLATCGGRWFAHRPAVALPGGEA
ncbi:MAG TPA: hypothetical protein VGJ32_13900 [Solirubrobacteraceae bacterium]|jgi:hypothetical protein